MQLGPNVQLLTPTHPVQPGPRRDKWEAAEPIVIGDNDWLGGGVIVCPGVTIGENTVVGAGGSRPGSALERGRGRESGADRQAAVTVPQPRVSWNPIMSIAAKVSSNMLTSCGSGQDDSLTTTNRLAGSTQISWP